MHAESVKFVYLYTVCMLITSTALNILVYISIPVTTISVLCFRLNGDLPDDDQETNGSTTEVSGLRHHKYATDLRGDSFHALSFLSSCYMGYVLRISCYGSADSASLFSPGSIGMCPKDIWFDIVSVKWLIEGDTQKNAVPMKLSDPHPLLLSISPKTLKGHLYR